MNGVLVTSPFGVLAFDPASAAIRPLTLAAWMRTIGGPAAHRARLADGRVTQVTSVRYRRDGPFAIDRDELGYRRLWLDMPSLLFMANGDEGIDPRTLSRVFQYRECADEAWSDLERLRMVLGAAQRATAAH